MSKSKRWKPKEGEAYWIITSMCNVADFVWLGVDFDRTHYRLGNCFKTTEKAEVVAHKLKEFWKDVREGKK